MKDILMVGRNGNSCLDIEYDLKKRGFIRESRSYYVNKDKGLSVRIANGQDINNVTNAVMGRFFYEVTFPHGVVDREILDFCISRLDKGGSVFSDGFLIFKYGMRFESPLVI